MKLRHKSVMNYSSHFCLLVWPVKAAEIRNSEQAREPQDGAGRAPVESVPAASQTCVLNETPVLSPSLECKWPASFPRSSDGICCPWVGPWARSQNTINHPEQSPGSCNKKVLKPQKGEPEDVPSQSRQISAAQWKKKALPSIKRVLTSLPPEASQISWGLVD